MGGEEREEVVVKNVDKREERDEMGKGKGEEEEQEEEREYIE